MMPFMFRIFLAVLLLLFATTSLVALFETVEPTAASIIAVLIVGMIFVGLPVGFAVKLLRRRRERDSPASQPDAKVPLEVEVLRLARRLDGRLTAMEVVTELGVSIDRAEAVLKDLNKRGVSGVLISDSGLLVYTFRDLEDLDEKDSAQPLLQS